MTLCQNRPEGFGPASRISSHLPTTCFVDVIVIPLATWVYLAILLIVVLSLSRPRTSSKSDRASNIQITEVKHVPGTSKIRIIVSKVLKVVYYFLLVAVVALLSLEIARLSTAQLGIGLLPFTYAGILAVLVLHVSAESGVSRRFHLSFTGSDEVRRKRWQHAVKSLNVLFWLMLMCGMAIKIAAQVEEEHVVGVRTGQQQKYPLSDEITDDAAMLGVELVLLGLELIST